MVDVTFATSEALMGFGCCGSARKCAAPWSARLVVTLVALFFFWTVVHCSCRGAATTAANVFFWGGGGGEGGTVRWSPQLGAEGKVRRAGLALGLEGPTARWAQAGAVLRAFWLSVSVPVLPVLARLRKGFGKTTAMPMGWLGKRARMQQQRLQNISTSSGRGTGGAIRGLAGGKAGGPGGCGVAGMRGGGGCGVAGDAGEMMPLIKTNSLLISAYNKTCGLHN